MRRSVLLFCVIMLAGQNSLAQPQANINAKKDNTLYEDATGALSDGAGEFFFIGKTKQDLIRRALIAFDLAGRIPGGAVIDSVKLRLVMSQTIAGAQPIQLYRVLADWGEGMSDAGGNEGMGATATTGDATWVHKFFNTSPWTKSGGDFAATPSASRTVGSVDIYFWDSTPQMVADVQLWLNSPASNFGWLLRGNETAFPTAKRFASREHLTPANRPVLTVFYHTTTRVENKNQTAPATFSLAQNYPNPFSAGGIVDNPSTTIRFELPAATNVTLQILDLSGRELETLAEGKFSAGAHQVNWHAKKYAGGVYLYRLEAGNFSATKKLVLLR